MNRHRIKLRHTALASHKAIKSRFVDQVRFLGALVQAPKRTGAVAPTSKQLADEMAAHIDLSSKLPVLELGPGTGPITKGILRTGLSRDRLHALEYDKRFCQQLRQSFHGINVIEGDAFNLEKSLDVAGLADTQFDTIISGLPLLNFPKELREKLLADVLLVLPKGRPFVQFSYGVAAPVTISDPEIEVTRSSWVLKNLPPARVWTYSRK